MIDRFGPLGRLAPFSAVAASLVAVVVGVGVAAKVGALELPSPDATLLAVGPTVGQWTYLLIAVLAFLETSTFLGLTLPGEVSIALGGVVAGQGVASLTGGEYPLVAPPSLRPTARRRRRLVRGRDLRLIVPPTFSRKETTHGGSRPR